MKIIRLQGQDEKQEGIFYEYDAHSTPLGEGGMGTVYQGYRIDERTGGRKGVAVKALHTNLPQEVYTRAEREASIRIKHDNLVEMLGFISVCETNRLGETMYRHYVISEYLDGIELSDLLVGHIDEKGNGDREFIRELYTRYVKERESTSIYIIRNILSGVLALHDKGYIHRDIDPSNVMVTSDGCIKLIDFGIAKKLNSLGTHDKLMTATGQFIGKAEYASPELVLGDVKSQNYTTDIYALGVLFYRLLVGCLPFVGTQYEIMECQKKKKIPVRNVKNKELAGIIRKATEKLQSRRYGSVAELRVAIDMAEKVKPNKLVQAIKLVAVLLLFCAVGFVVKECTNNVPISGMSYSVQDALQLLDSDNPDSVRFGFEQIRTMADNGNDTARVEIGITYFANRNNKTITHRRTLLEMDNGDNRKPSELDLVIKYISSVGNRDVISPEVYYILGCAYWFKDKKDSANALNSFEKALALLNLNVNASHGYNNTELKSILENNIESLKQ